MIKKWCYVCKEEKPYSEFHKNKIRKDGLTSECKDCRKKMMSKRYKDNREVELQRSKDWQSNNPDKVKKQRKQYRIKNREKLITNKKIYDQTLKGRFLHYKSSAKQRGHEFSLSLEDFSKFWQKNCTYCNQIILTVGLDRVNSQKGYTLDNVVSCCRNCNIAKNDRSVSEFINHCREVVKNDKYKSIPNF